MSFWGFLRLAIIRAWHHAEHIGHKAHLIALLLVGASIIASVYFGIHLEELIIPVLTFVVVMLVFVFGVSYQMYAIYREESEKRMDFISDNDKRFLEQNDKHQKELQVLKLQINAKASQKTNCDEIKATRLEISRWITAGENIVTKIESYTEPERTMRSSFIIMLPNDLRSDIQRWVRDTDDFVAKKASAFCRQYRDFSGIPTPSPLGDKRSPEFTQSRNEVSNRVERLRELHNLATQP